MGKSVIIHLMGEDPMVAEIEQMPVAGDTFVTLTNARRRDGKSIPNHTQGAQAFLYPMHRITFIEFMEGAKQEERVVEFFREES